MTNDDGTVTGATLISAPAGTAELAVSVTDGSGNPVTSEISYQPQPASVVLMSYLDTSHIYGSYTYAHPTDFIYGYINDSVNWFYAAGGEQDYMAYSLLEAIEWGNGFSYNTADFPSGENGFSTPWEYADLSFDLGYYDVSGGYNCVICLG